MRRYGFKNLIVTEIAQGEESEGISKTKVSG